MKNILLLTALVGITLCNGAEVEVKADTPKVINMTNEVQNVIVADIPGKFLGWPANEGIWNWGDEILVGFNESMYKLNTKGHSVNPKYPTLDAFARSYDGGKTWAYENATYQQRKKSADGLGEDEIKVKGKKLDQSINFLEADTILKFRLNHFWVSKNRGKEWNGPFILDIKEIDKPLRGRTDYVIDSENVIKIFLPTLKSDNSSGRCFMAESVDGAQNFKFVSYLSEEPKIYEDKKQSEHSFSIMPSTIRADNGNLITALRCRDGKKKWLEIRESSDDGKSWKLIAIPSTMAWNPPALIKLKDGRLCLTYADRCKPYSLRARLSSDNGKTWGETKILRQDADSWDIGYVRSVQRLDGKIVTIYYHRTKEMPEQFIAATIWQP